MGNVPEEETVRNESIAHDYNLYLKKALTMKDLRFKYPDISETRIRQIGKKWVLKLGLK